MHQSIWSSPQVGGSGGALKALARNVANHLKLNRSSMKRVVAQVVAEHHTLGEVADYKGHMYFAKPDRLNFHQLIAQSKEAFDDLLLHEPRSAKRRSTIRQRSKNPLSSKVNLQMKVSPPQLPGSGVAKKASAAKKTEARPKNRRRRKSSTTIFQLADAGRRSLNGVIIDDTHLPHDGEQREILLHVPSTLTRRSRRRLRSSPTRVATEKKAERRDQSPKKAKMKKSQEPDSLDKKISEQGKKRLPEKNCLLEKNCVPEKNRLPEKNRQKPKLKKPLGSPPSVTRPGSPAQKVSQQRRSPRRNNARSRPASHQRIKAGDTRNSATKPLTKTNSVQKTKTRLKLRPLKKRLPLLRRSYEKPWLVRGLKRRRLSGGSQLAKLGNRKNSPVKPQRLDKIDVEWEKKSGPSARSSKLVDSIKSSSKLKGKRPSHVGRQMRKVYFPWYTPYQFQGAAGATQIPNAGVGIPPYQLLREKSRKLNRRLTATQSTQIPPSRRAPNFTSRQRHHRQMQERLMRDLQREEAIDEPLSNGSGVFRRSRGGGGGWQPQRIIIKSEPEPKQQQDHRSVERVSSRMKRLANDRRCRQPIATSERIMIPPPKNNTRPHSSPRIRRRFRCVPVDSSLGSIALMGQPEQSKPGLTPAKRHLTIAFMNKRSERNSAAIQPWK